jgi:lipooligosaccharide transport system permease protein
MLAVAIAIPIATVGGIGWGIGSLVSAGSEASRLGGVDYLDFVAPALVVAGSWQGAAGDSLWPILGHLKWLHTYDGMVATTLGVPDVVVGHLWWIVYRNLLSSVLATIVLAAFGVPHSWLVLLLPLVAVLTAVAVAAPLMAFSATREEDQAFALAYRMGVVPLFLFSGTFYPVDQLPEVLQAVVRVVPLWHGVELARGASLGTLDLLPALGHAAYLLLWFVVGFTLALRTFRRRLLA